MYSFFCQKKHVRNWCDSITNQHAHHHGILTTSPSHHAIFGTAHTRHPTFSPDLIPWFCMAEASVTDSRGHLEKIQKFKGSTITPGRQVVWKICVIFLNPVIGASPYEETRLKVVSDLVRLYEYKREKRPREASSRPFCGKVHESSSESRNGNRTQSSGKSLHLRET